jgi:hypothetical protein
VGAAVTPAKFSTTTCVEACGNTLQHVEDGAISVDEPVGWKIFSENFGKALAPTGRGPVELSYRLPQGKRGNDRI